MTSASLSPRAAAAGGAAAVPTSVVLWYALPQVPHSFAMLPVVNYVPGFYADHVGMPLALVGLILVLTRLADAFIDPFVGSWTDRTRSRFGRRKPFIVAGLPPLMAATWAVFAPPDQVGPVYLFFGLFVLYLGFTIVDIPYVAWGAELSNDYDERSRISAWRAVAGTAGSLITLAIPVLLQQVGRSDVVTAMRAMALCFLVLQPICFGLALWKVKEPPEERVPAPPLPWRQRWGVLLANGPFMGLCAALSLLIIGMAVGATLNMIIFKHVIGEPDLFASGIFAQNVVAIACIPVWLAVSKRFGKHRAMAIGAAMIGVFTALSWFAGRGDGGYLSALLIGIGAAMGGTLALVSAMVADLVDRDLVETGEERTGLFFAALGFATKVATVAGVLIGTAIPGLAGFQPSDPTHSAASIEVLRLVYALTCPVLAIPAAIILWRYPLTRARQEEYRREIAARRSGASGAVA